MSSVKRDIVNELHKPARINFTRRKVIIRGLDDLFQADLVEMIPYAKYNKGYRYILVVIDTFSKYVWALPLGGKSGQEVTDAMKEILNTNNRIPKNLQTDMVTFSTLPKFHIGDHVRICKHRSVFDKGYTPNWSNEIFTISKIKYTNPVTYLLSDAKSQDIRGCFYTEELQKVKHPDVYLVEKILKKKGNQIFGIGLLQLRNLLIGDNTVISLRGAKLWSRQTLIEPWCQIG
ncbi:hypothetical protein NQ318_007239 [Aromia moschata]|uniref:Integrase catalytic domain-containing protein n=1 Tax=Aromia moschata TaxID=1265417 RepID=A0AAV8X415_9CUCU|nr:hypothetical protein NQ318_007239 [Aromia moschata]